MAATIIPRQLAATIIVAASDSLETWRASWDDTLGRYLICDGTDDQEEINQALTAAAGGSVLLLDGNYSIAANLTVPADTHFMGVGKNTIITTTDNIAITNAVVINGHNVTISDMKIVLGAGAGDVGSRPNVIYASGKNMVWLQNLWLRGDITVADDADDGRQNGMYLDVEKSKILDCFVENNKRHGCYSINGARNTIEGNTFWGNTQHGLLVNGDMHDIVVGNLCEANTKCGIYLNNVPLITVVGNSCRNNDESGIQLTSVGNSTITGNSFVGNVQHGIHLASSSYNTVTGNTCNGNDDSGTTYSGIYVSASDYCIITGNQCEANGLHGISLSRSSYCVITGNGCTGQTTGDGINVTGDGTANADYNEITGNNCYNNGSHGIEIVGGTDANYNHVVNNELTGNTTAPFADAGTNTRLAAYVVPFSDGDDPQDSGYEIDVAAEYARAWLRLPAEVQQVVRMKIYARAIILSAAAMRLEINVNGAADNEAFNTHATAAPNTPSTSTNFAADDVIYWTLTSAEIVALLGGDSVEVKVLYEDAGNGDVVTDAFLRTVEFEYV